MNTAPGYPPLAAAYRVRATRWAHGWELHVADVGVTQSHGLYDAEQTARDYLASVYELTDAEAAALAIEITPAD